MKVLAAWRLVSWLIVSSCPAVFSVTNICPRRENYTVTSMETYAEPVIVNTFTWCLQIPPRCPITRTEMRQRYRVKTETRSRTVTECCDGYSKMISSGNEMANIVCVPFCEKCVSGVCVLPNRCQCIPGYEGDTCDTACPEGSWGTGCKERCNCTGDVPCDPVNGRCACPPGLRGRMCNESCPSDRWGAECRFPCDCADSGNRCDPETGRCTAHGHETESNSVATDISVSRESKPKETTGSDARGSSGDRAGEDDSRATSVDSDVTVIADASKSSSTSRPVIVLVSVPERRRNPDKDLGTFAAKNAFARHVDGDASVHVVRPKTDYVKNLHKDESPAQIPLDIALIVVASIVSLGLTSVAVVMILHMRSKLLETTRISMYEEEAAATIRRASPCTNGISSIVTATLPQPPSRLAGPFTGTLEPQRNRGSSMPIECMELSNGYANGTATLRVSSNLRGLPQDDHYDRPPATRNRLPGDVDPNAEHVYDEIPLQSSPLDAFGIA